MVELGCGESLRPWRCATAEALRHGRPVAAPRLSCCRATPVLDDPEGTC